MKTFKVLLLTFCIYPFITQAGQYRSESTVDSKASTKQVKIESVNYSNNLFMKPMKKRKSSFAGGVELSASAVLGAGIAPGISGKFLWAKDEKYCIYGKAGFLFPSKKEITDYGYAFSSATSPSQIEFTADQKVSGVQIIVGYQRYFVGDFEDDFNFYGSAAAGLTFWNVKYSNISYDKSLYYSTLAEDGEKLSGFILYGTLGIEKNLDFAYLYFEGHIGFPATNVGGAAVDVEVPPYVGLTAGLRFPF